jgi:penicillin amidase
MNAFKRILIALLILLVLALTTVILLVNNIRNKAVADYGKPVDIENLAEPVTVYRDSLGIPHVYAKSEEDLYRVVGYLSAQDRLWQMDLMRRITTGRLSEIFGADMLAADQLFRSFEFSKKSEDVLSKTDPEMLRCLEAYTDGVNQYIKKNNRKLSFEFTLLGYKPENWTLTHTTNLIGYMAWDLTSGWSTDMAMYKISQLVDDSLLMELFPDPGVQSRHVFPEYMSSNNELAIRSTLDEAVRSVDELGLQVFQASNNWAVSGGKSTSGMPLLANDMHLGFMSPGIWYQMHHVVEGKLNVTGVVLPGQPYVICGHNEDIAWGMTNVTVDNLDFYLETINPADTNQYKLNGRWVDMRIVEETIAVKGDDPVVRTNRFTHRGPIVSSFKGISDKVISARWIGTDYSNELRTVHLFNRASNWGEFREAASSFVAISQNIVYADRQGNIGLQCAAGVPLRKGDPVMIYPGDTTLYDWQGIVPFEDLPYEFNPERGYVSSANNKTVGEDYPYYMGTWYSLPNRIDRIRELLEETGQHGNEDFKRIHSDQLSAFARKLTPVYLDALNETYEDTEKAAFESLQSWNYVMDKSMAAPLIYEQIFPELMHALYADELGDHYPLILDNNTIARHHIYALAEKGISAWCDNITTTDRTETFDDAIRTAFSRAVDTLSALVGPDVSTWKWGDVHTITIEHPMGGVSIVNKLFKPNLGPHAVGGSFHTVAPFSYPVGKSYKVTHGASQRHIYSTADWDASETVIPTGTSGVPASEYYGNQTKMYLNFKYHSDPFTREAVEKRAKYTTLFE